MRTGLKVPYPPPPARWCCSVHAHSPPTRRGSWLMPRGTATAQLTTDAAALPALQPLPIIEPGRTCMGNTPPVSFWVGLDEPRDWSSGSGGTGGVAGDWLLARDREQGALHSWHARMLVCTFLDPGKILLCSVLGQYVSEVVSKPIMQGQFLGGSGSGLPYQVIRFRPLSWHTHLKCSRRPGWPGVQNGALGGSWPGI